MPKRAAALIASQLMSLGKAPRSRGKAPGPRPNAATGWRRRTLRLVELCMKLDGEHVLCKAMRRWPVAALLEAMEGWTAAMFALVVRDWRLKKVARMLEAKGRAFTVECCAEWEPEYLQMLLPEIELVTARHVLAELYFKSDDKHLSPYECRQIIEQYGPKAQRKLLRKFCERDVERVLRASPTDGSSDEDDSEEDEDEENSMDGFIVEDGGDDDDTEGFQIGRGEEDDDGENEENGDGDSDDDDEVGPCSGPAAMDEDDDDSSDSDGHCDDGSEEESSDDD